MHLRRVSVRVARHGASEKEGWKVVPRRRTPVWLASVGVLLLGLVTVAFATHRFAILTDALVHRSTPADRFDLRYVENPLSSYVHIVCGSLLMLIGPLQFLPRLRNRWLWLHRYSGRVFVVAGTVAGVSALALAVRLPAFGGLTTQAATLFFGPLFLVCLLKAFYHIRRREIALHREWMIRAFAIGLGVSTIRLYIPILVAFSGRTFEQVFGPSFWLAFCTHAVAAEVWIRRTRTRSVAAPRS